MLSNYVLKNFEIPKSNIKYFCDSLGVPVIGNRSYILNMLNYKIENANNYFDIELPLRAIEICFSCGNGANTKSEYLELNYLISKLYVSVFKKTKQEQTLLN